MLASPEHRIPFLPIKKSLLFFKGAQLPFLEEASFNVSLTSAVWYPPAKHKFSPQSLDTASVLMWEHMLPVSGADLGAETRICVYKTMKPETYIIGDLGCLLFWMED